MKIQLASLPLILSVGNAFVVPQQGSQVTALNDNVNSMWAFDVYGREDGELPSLEIMYGEGDPWYFNPRSGISQSDFYPSVSSKIKILLKMWQAIVLPPKVVGTNVFFSSNRAMQGTDCRQQHQPKPSRLKKVGLLLLNLWKQPHKLLLCLLRSNQRRYQRWICPRSSRLKPTYEGMVQPASKLRRYKLILLIC